MRSLAREESEESPEESDLKKLASVTVDAAAPNPLHTPTSWARDERALLADIRSRPRYAYGLVELKSTSMLLTRARALPWLELRRDRVELLQRLRLRRQLQVARSISIGAGETWARGGATVTSTGIAGVATSNVVPGADPCGICTWSVTPFGACACNVWPGPAPGGTWT